MPAIVGTTRKTANSFPTFQPHPLLRSGHAQTLAANYLPGAPRVRTAQSSHKVAVADGDRIVLHDDRPASWGRGDPAVLLLHGLGGCHQSAYMFRTARKLNSRGVRAFRMDYRSCGAGRGLAQRYYHAGQSDDVIAALGFLARTCPGSPLGMAGFSMGGNVALKTLGENPAALPDELARAAVVNPAIDLAACCDFLTGPIQRLYDRHFARSLVRHVSEDADFATLAHRLAASPVDRIRDFDERFTVPHWGFDTVEDYYRLASAAPHIAGVRVPTLVLHSRDDPLIPAKLFTALEVPETVTVHLAAGGGHLGFIGPGGVDPDRRWMDWRIVDWLTSRIDAGDVRDATTRRSWRCLIRRSSGASAVKSPTERDPGTLIGTDSR